MSECHAPRYEGTALCLRTCPRYGRCMGRTISVPVATVCPEFTVSEATAVAMSVHHAIEEIGDPESETGRELQSALTKIQNAQPRKTT